MSALTKNIRDAVANLAKLCGEIHQYDTGAAKRKEDMHRLGLKRPRAVAKRYPDARCWSNKGDIAVSGEVTMQGSNVWFQAFTAAVAFVKDMYPA